MHDDLYDSSIHRLRKLFELSVIRLINQEEVVKSRELENIANADQETDNILSQK